VRATTFPLLSARRGVGLTGGSRRSVHRGIGFDVASSRPYRRGDSMRTIDWKASARLASAHDADEFVVREHFADDRLRAVIVVDRRPEMALYPSDLPWLHKPAAVAAAGQMITDSALASQGLPGYLDLAAPHAPRWLPPDRQGMAVRIREGELLRPAFTAPADNVALALRHLARSRASVPAGSFVFVLSDFLVATPVSAWRNAVSLGWDVVPVIVQDPRWEQSFPAASGLALPLGDATGSQVRLVRLTRSEAAARRTANELRLEELLRLFAQLDLDPVLLSSEDRRDILAAFLNWHERRLRRLRRR
jgi:uncharacterized protein (DUF58 family)